MAPKVVISGMEMSETFRQRFGRVFAETDAVQVSADRDAVLAAMPGAVVLADKAATIDSDVIDAAGGTLKGICLFGIGFDRVDVAAATERGIPVVNAPVFAASMAEANLTLMLAVTHKLLSKVEQARAGKPRNDSLRGATLDGRTLGLVGFGRIGRETGKRAAAFGMHVVAYDPFLTANQIREAGAEPASLSELLKVSDFVSLNCNLTEENRHLINRETLAQMRPGAVLINVARGPLVDEAAVTEALESGRLGGAGLDVLEREPPLPSNLLLKMPNVVVTPHCLGATWDGIAQVIDAVQESTLRILAGEEPRWVVNREVLRS